MSEVSKMDMVLLGSDYQYAFGPLGSMGATGYTYEVSDFGMGRPYDLMVKKSEYYAKLGYSKADCVKMAIIDYDKDQAGGSNTVAPKPAGGLSSAEILGLIQQLGPKAIDATSDIVGYLKGIRPGLSAEDYAAIAASMRDSGGSGDIDDFLKKNGTMLAIGGVAVVALLFMAGTSGRRKA